MSLDLLIAHTWDGHPLPAAARALVQLASDGEDLLLRVLAPFEHDPRPPGPPGPTAGLWNHEVVELFVAGEGAAYVEVEIGPFGHHLVLLLADVRRPSAERLPLALTTGRYGETHWAAEARLPRAWLPPPPHRLNAYRIHGPPTDRRYLCHAPLPGPAPDFHQPARFPTATLPTGPSDPTDDAARALRALFGEAAVPDEHARVESEGWTEAVVRLGAQLRG